MQAYFETSDNVLLNYTIHRKGKRPMILLHGWGGQQIALNTLVNSLEGDYTVITYDQRGFGKSERPRLGYTAERLAQDLKELIEHLELEDVLLLGWSMGGLVSSVYLDTYGSSRIAGLILVDVNARILSDDNYRHGFYSGNYTKADCLDDLVKMVHDFALFAEEMPEKGNMVLFDETMRRAFIDKVIAQNPDPTPCICLWTVLADTDLTEIYKRIDIPVLFCHGGHSTYCSPEACAFVAGLIPDVEVAEFPECSHFIPIERPKEMAEAIDRFAEARFS